MLQTKCLATHHKLIISCFCIIFALLITNQAEAATCKANLVSPTQLDNNFWGTLVLETPGPCFQPNTGYRVVAFPSSIGLVQAIKNSMFIPFGTSIINKNGAAVQTNTHIEAELNLTQTGQKFANVPWEIIVCSPNPDWESCASESNLLARTGLITLSQTPTPSPTPPDDVPIIDISSQAQCIYQQGSTIQINHITNLAPSIGYYYWWEGEGFLGTRASAGTFTSDAQGSDMSLTIPGTATNRLGTRRLCVASRNLLSPRAEQNCINLKFVVQKPSENFSCDNKTRGPATLCTPEIIQSCEKDNSFCQDGKCVANTSSAGFICDTKNPDPDPITNVPRNKGNGNGVWTAIGCVPTQPTKLIQGLLRIATGAGGAIALLLAIGGIFQMMTSAGNPDGLKKGSEQLTSAMTGLLFIIFSVMLLKIIGVDILAIPGFSP